MLYRRARSGLVLIAVFWLWMLFGAADFVAVLFSFPMHAALAVFGLGVLSLVSLLFLPICTAYLILHRPLASGSAEASRQGREHGNGRLASVVPLVSRRAAARAAALSGRAAAKWRDLAS